MGAVFGWIVWAGFVLFLIRKIYRYVWLRRNVDLFHYDGPLPRTTADIPSEISEAGAFCYSFWPQLIYSILLLWMTWELEWGKLLILPLGYVGYIVIYGFGCHSHA